MNDEAILPWYIRRKKLCFALFALVFLSLNAWLFSEEYRVWKAARAAQQKAEAFEEASDFFEDDEAFEPLGAAEAGDWQSQFDEKPQSFIDWKHTPRPHPTGKRDRLYLQPIGAFDPDTSLDLDVLAEFAEVYFDMPVTVREPLDADELDVRSRENAFHGQKQWYTRDLLEELYSRLPGDAFAVLGLTMTDLWPGKGWNYVFGEATFQERVGVHSFARYDPAAPISRHPPEGLDAERAMLLRALKVLAHETGHMFGIRHCLHYECNLNGTNSLGELDEQPVHMCPVDLRKLHAAIGFDPAERYKELAAFYERHGLDEQAAFVRGRIGRR